MRQSFIIVAMMSAVAHAGCVMHQNCTESSHQGCHPYPVSGSEKEPTPYSGPAMFDVCPEYNNASCCTLQQSQSLWVNFQLLDSAFGNVQAGGCPACAQNLKRMWCTLTCSPHQSDFLSFTGMRQMIDPGSGSDKPVTVLTANVTIDRKLACDQYASCEDTATIKQDTAMTSCRSFLEYQGSTKAISHGLSLNFLFEDAAPDAMRFPLSNCCSFPRDFTNPAAGNTSCPCAACSGMCPGKTCVDNVAPVGRNDSQPLPRNLDAKRFGIMHGFEWIPVVALYGSVALITVLVAWWQRT